MHPCIKQCRTTQGKSPLTGGNIICLKLFNHVSKGSICYRGSTIISICLKVFNHIYKESLCLSSRFWSHLHALVVVEYLIQPAHHALVDVLKTFKCLANLFYICSSILYFVESTTVQNNMSCTKHKIRRQWLIISEKSKQV